MVGTISTASLIGVVVGSGITYLLVNRNSKRRFRHIELEVKAKAKAIENEAELLLKSTHVKMRERELAQEEQFQKKMVKVDKQNRELILETKEMRNKTKELDSIKERLEDRQNDIDALESKKQKEIDEVISKMESIASLTKEEAKSYILEKVEANSRAEIAGIVRKYDKIAKEDAQKNANYILAQATTRFAGDFAGERLINLVTLPSDEHKGRIIGKEGRNIKTLEMLLGVDIVVDDTPATIIVSSFNLYRRAIATRVIELLVEDGRIHPGRIEEVHEKVEREFEQKTFEEGENIIIDWGLFPMNDELIRLIGKLKYRASYGQNALAHTLEVAKLAQIMTAEMGGDEKLALRAGLLHDIGKALTQEQGGSHVDIGVQLCKKYKEHPTVINAIYAHHGYEEPDSIESAAVCAGDKLSAARPGARREVLENFTKRVKEIEDIATSREFVNNAYAINAGREIRVFVNAQKMSDNEAVLLSKEIAKEIEQKVQYPGEIKVNVIRESRSVHYAK